MRYPSIRTAILANADDEFNVPGSRHTMRLAILDGGPNENGSVSLIPQANVLQAAHYGDLGRSPVAPTDLDWGAILHVQGFGCFKVVSGGSCSRDWPKLVPQDGDRFYTKYEGGPGYQNWAILDRETDGGVIDWDLRSETSTKLFGTKSPQNRAQANAIAAFLSATTTDLPA